MTARGTKFSLAIISSVPRWRAELLVQDGGDLGIEFSQRLVADGGSANGSR
jgi:hypothetical protein